MLLKENRGKDFQESNSSNKWKGKYNQTGS